MAPLTSSGHRKKVAIIGSGCSGIAALWALNRSPHDVYLYEAADRLGGHTNAVEYRHGKYKTKVDTGFIVLNSATSRMSAGSSYVSRTNGVLANSIAFLKTLGVRTAPTEMTFSVSRDSGSFEWSSTSLSSIFAQRRNALSPTFWRIIFDIIRFNQFALDILKRGQDSEEDAPENGVHSAERQGTIGQYLYREGYSDAFRDDYLIPVMAAVWSTSPDKCILEFPAVTLVRFM